VGVGECVVDGLARTASKQFFAIVANSCWCPTVCIFLLAADSDLMKLLSEFKQEAGFEYQKPIRTEALASEVFTNIFCVMEWKKRYQRLGEWSPPWKDKEAKARHYMKRKAGLKPRSTPT
jgi:hypothetical protein